VLNNLRLFIFFLFHTDNSAQNRRKISLYDENPAFIYSAGNARAGSLEQAL